MALASVQVLDSSFQFSLLEIPQFLLQLRDLRLELSILSS